MLKLPSGITTCLFDLDGVLTQTARLHAEAWKRTFDAFLRDVGRTRRSIHRPTTPTYVDGRPRADGVTAFLASRGIHPGPGTRQALAAHKQELVLGLIRRRGVRRYEGSVRFAEAAGAVGLRRAVVSSSRDCREVLAAAGLAHLAEVVVDGVVADRLGLAGKPAPDAFLAAAEMLRAGPAEAAVFEDSLAGVQAGRAGGFGWVVGVDRGGRAAASAPSRRRRGGGRPRRAPLRRSRRCDGPAPLLACGPMSVLQRYSTVEHVEGVRGPLRARDREIAFHYLDLGLSSTECGRRLHMSPSAVLRRLAACGIAGRPPGGSFLRIPERQLRRAAFLYERLGLSLAAVAEIEGVHPNAVRHRLKAAGVPLRRPGARREER